MTRVPQRAAFAEMSTADISKPHASAPRLCLGEMRSIVRDLYSASPLIYWSDFLVSMTVGYAAASIYLHAPWGPAKALAFFVAGVAIYRLSAFMHEIVHLRANEMQSFSFAWNLLAGVPLLMPTFFYQSHNQHHNAHHYGTKRDGEYLPLGRRTWASTALFLLQVLVQPIFVSLRFAIGTPISFLHPALRRWTLERASSFVIDFRHRRELKANDPRALWAIMDTLCCLRIHAMLICAVVGVTDWTRIPQIYVLAVFILSMNHFRTLTAHRYMNDGGSKMSHEDQLFDSVDIIGDPIITELFCPLGMRYHALHHLFPSMPYHNLGVAHRRLMKQLPLDAPYREVVRANFVEVLRELRASIASSS